MEDNYGHMEIRLNELLKEKGLSKNKLSHKAELFYVVQTMFYSQSIILQQFRFILLIIKYMPDAYNVYF